MWWRNGCATRPCAPAVGAKGIACFRAKRPWMRSSTALSPDTALLGQLKTATATGRTNWGVGVSGSVIGVVGKPPYSFD